MATVSVNNRMVILPQKKTYEVNMTYPLQQYIKQNYTSNLEDFIKSAEALNQLRSEALFKANRQEKLNKLIRYYDQMTAIEGKLPISENQIRVQFKWQDAFGGSLFGNKNLALSSGLYERLCVLFNIAAVASDVAAIQQLDTEEGLKTAMRLYQQAAGALSFIRDSALTTTRSDCTSDFYHDTLSCLISIMVAQAQEILYTKAVKDKMKELIVSKLAMQCSDFYADAMKLLQTDSLKDLQKQLLPVIAGKQALFHGLGEYHKAMQDDADKNIGESLARLTRSLELLKVAEQRGGKELPVKASLATVQLAYDKAKKENDYVYHERVPDYKSLAQLERAALAKPTPVKFPISEDFKDLFTTMVPMAVNQGLSMFKSKKQEAFNLEIGKLRQATELLNAALSALNLPAAIEDVSAQSNKLPQSLIDKSQLIKDRGGIQKVDSMMAELPPLLKRNTEILDESKRILDEEAASDNELRAQLGNKWTRTPSAQLNTYLFKEVEDYKNIINNAIRANSIIEEKYKKNRDGIQLLSRPLNEITASLPAASPISALQGSFVVKELRRLLDKLDGVRNVRDVLESQMKTADSDALTARLISSLQTTSGMDQHSIIQQELEEVVGPLRQQVKENLQEQQELLGNLERANADFLKEKGGNQSSELRDEMMKNLAAASSIYNELYDNLQEGVKFYNELTPILLKFQTKVNDFVFARKTEKDDLMKDIQSSLTRPGSGPSQASALQKPARPAPPPPATNDHYQQQQAAAQPPAYPPNPYYPMMPAYPYPYYPQQPNNQAGGPPGAYPPYPYYPPAPK